MLPHRKEEPRATEPEFVLPLVIEKEGDGYFVFCPSLQGCYTDGDSYDKVLNHRGRRKFAHRGSPR
jgi:hypothetical protein